MKPPPDEAIRARVRTDFATTLVLEAGAGTGKTTVLVDRLVNLVVSGTATLDRIVAITFTEAAAGELKMRLRDALERRLGSASTAEAALLSRALIDLERANVSTIHAFAAALLRERPFESGIDPSFSVVAEVAGERTFDDAWNAWVEETVTKGDEVLMRAVHLGLAIGDLQKAARSVVAERDVLGLPVARATVRLHRFAGRTGEGARALEEAEEMLRRGVGRRVSGDRGARRTRPGGEAALGHRARSVHAPDEDCRSQRQPGQLGSEDRVWRGEGRAQAPEGARRSLGEAVRRRRQPGAARAPAGFPFDV